MWGFFTIEKVSFVKVASLFFHGYIIAFSSENLNYITVECHVLKCYTIMDPNGHRQWAGPSLRMFVQTLPSVRVCLARLTHRLENTNLLVGDANELLHSPVPSFGSFSSSNGGWSIGR